ncbi:MAG: tRNA preQ1(34) S-adenosylmethionine ribosyltransferase-isomerase QueA [Candidatus Omnitrophota bacterium]|nr:tRNA preQ1(34) S-adenosylmethionine ribosyltransferase-isomerase QueA [Candidatus Omnitrophota bacterium]
MKLTDFDYQVPKELIAQFPLKKRDACRLLVIERISGKIYHDKFCRILDYLPKPSCLVLNDSKVIPARLLGKREETQGKVEVLILEKLKERNTFHALINPLKKLKIDERIIFNGNKISCRLVDAKNRIVRFNADIQKHLDRIGHIPLPPYIKRPDAALDRKYYQTVYAKNKGSVASPTAGLHFTKNLLQKIQKNGIKVAKVTLHVNFATFNPVKEVDITKHKMHSEEYSVEKSTMKTIQDIRKGQGKIIAVGTTSCRVLETIAQNHKLKGSTDIFIYPGYKFKFTDGLLTNFHFPKTTLFMLVCAFANRRLIMRAYEEAIERKYRFYSYGDAMLIL